jgi:acetate kinase
LRVLVVNAGSSSLKLRLLDGDELIGKRDLPALGEEGDREAVAAAVDELEPADAVGHRIVHGGEHYRDPVLIDAGVERALRELVDLAPLHQPKSLAALDAVSDALPELPAVACFDTAFHAGMPAAAATYALPATWREHLGLRRYGFHGLSHAYAARRATELLGRSNLRLVTCHLGAGASLAAVRDGRSVDTTMGFTPLEGLVMATRSGSIDPGALLWLLERGGVNERELAETLEHRSGLLGLAGTAEMPDVLARADAGEPDATIALDVYTHRLRASIAAMAAAIGGLEALAFTGGVGENSPRVRQRACQGLGFLGIALDEEANAASAPDVRVEQAGTAVSVLVIESREDLEIAAQVRTLLA